MKTEAEARESAQALANATRDPYVVFRDLWFLAPHNNGCCNAKVFHSVNPRTMVVVETIEPEASCQSAS